MLKQRVLTALVLAPLVLWGILFLETQHLAYGLMFFVVVGAWEWSALIGLTSWLARLAYAGAVAAVLVLLLSFVENPVIVNSLLYIALVWWIVALFLIASYRGEKGIQNKYLLLNIVIGFILLVPTWLALLSLHSMGEKGPLLVLFVLTIVWVADSGAYFVGRKFGRIKLAPHVSPGKSREGVYGALVASSIYAGMMGHFWLELTSFQLVILILTSIVVVVFSVAGDLLESLYKRRAGIKDSGKIFPGHGGVLDRIDSVTAAAPLFALGLGLLESV